eukprot:TRINITY_DN19998_c1_g1_i11.p1 TRINITY_DN19998_c1_g1~~TRINITY_DN19998_c1_g1_i11.p1  ORF type:complete len:642 (+),score=68.83 TRINITY_DN19998_c1_g1_i11:148-2073(+)
MATGVAATALGFGFGAASAGQAAANHAATNARGIGSRTQSTRWRGRESHGLQMALGTIRQPAASLADLHKGGGGGLSGSLPSNQSVGGTMGAFSEAPLVAYFARQQERLTRKMYIVLSETIWRKEIQDLVKTTCSVFLFFKKQGCPSCNCMAPKVHDASIDFDLQHGTDCLFIEVDVDACPTVARKYTIDFTPSFCMLRHGELIETFSGVSGAVFNKQLKRLATATAACQECCGDLLTTLESLADVLNRRPAMYQSCSQSRAAATEILSDFPDEGLMMSQARQQVYDWLVKRHGHPSLWRVDEWQAFNTSTDAVVSRRAARAEFWLLGTISGLSGRKTSLKHWTSELRQLLNQQLEKLWESTRPCSHSCEACELPCVMCHDHVAGLHTCGTDDHKCHRVVEAEEDDEARRASKSSTTVLRHRLRCPLHAGHSGPCKYLALGVLSDAATCAICLEMMWPSGDGDRDFARLECGHSYHLACAAPWLQRAESCPVCRSPTSASWKEGKHSAAVNAALAGWGSTQSCGSRSRRLAPLQLNRDYSAGRAILRQQSRGVLRPRDLLPLHDFNAALDSPSSPASPATPAAPGEVGRLGALPPLGFVPSLLLPVHSQISPPASARGGGDLSSRRLGSSRGVASGRLHPP